jgi:5'-deoxynucleotidase YfbR-like HD superfamily hydrolase
MLKKIVNFIFERGHARFVPRSGWLYLRIKNPQNDAEHSARVGMISFVLAIMEGIDNPYYVATMGLFHEIAEDRTNDPNSISKQYVTADEDRAVQDQTADIGEAGKKILEMWRECDEHKTHSGKIAKDADRLEMMFSAKEYMETGYPCAEDFFKSAFPLLETKSAKELALVLQDTSSNEWWRTIQHKKQK